MDVVEMDAASNTGVDDVREIIEGVRYAAVSARYKIHIIDEVHMLSKAAFNALLKTLEEPPPGVKFIMATTEVNKVPATILSRCQRFDLKRVPAEMLADHFARILEQEQVQYETDPLALVARDAEGSYRAAASTFREAHGFPLWELGVAIHASQGGARRRTLVDVEYDVAPANPLHEALETLTFDTVMLNGDRKSERLVMARIGGVWQVAQIDFEKVDAN
jgi:hypothetical protein